MEFSISTGAWLRPKLLDIFCLHYAQLQTKYKFDLIVSCSDETSKRIVKSYGHKVISVPNKPLFKKFNSSLKASRRGDFVILIGSDDFISESTIYYYIEKIKQGYEYIYTTDWYFYDTKSKQGLYWAGYRKKFNTGNACGAGRVLSRAMVNRLRGELWSKGFDHVLDTSADINLKRLNPKSHGFSLKEQGLISLDIKTEVNMTPFELWDNSFIINGNDLVKNNFTKLADKILNY